MTAQARRRALLAGTALAMLSLAPAGPARAVDAPWEANPASDSFNSSANWVGGVVPDGTATFGASTQTYVRFSAPTTTIGGITLSPGAPAYWLEWDFVSPDFPVINVVGNGVVTNGGDLTLGIADWRFSNAGTAGAAKFRSAIVTFNDTSNAGTADTYLSNLTFNGTASAANASIVAAGGDLITFNGASTAGSATIANVGSFSEIVFNGTSTAGDANISTTSSSARVTFNGDSRAGTAGITIGAGGAGFGILSFNGTSSAENAVIDVVMGAVIFSGSSKGGNATINNNGEISFGDSSTAGSATINNNAGAGIYFFGGTAGNATINNSGTVEFSGIDSTGGNAQLINNAGGVVTISPTNVFLGDRKLSFGSIAGEGTFNLNNAELTVGSNNLSTTVSGVITGDPTRGGSLVKVGTGTLTLTGNNTYRGGTTVSGGTLQLGTLATQGTILGAVNVVGAQSNLSVVNANMTGVTSITSSGAVTFRNASTAGTANITLEGLTNNLPDMARLTFADTSSAADANITIRRPALATFQDNSTAGNATILQDGIGELGFRNSSSAASATITNNMIVAFRDNSTASNAAIVNNNTLGFLNNSTAANATITGAGSVTFTDTSTAAAANIGAASVNFIGQATGGTAAIAASTLSINGLTTGGLTIGSLAAQFVNLGANNLTFGSLNTNNAISGVISGVGGSLTKTGTGTTTLSGNNTYTGGTTLAGGTLVLAHNNALGTGALTTTGSVVAYANGVTIGNPITLASNSTQLSVADGFTATQAGAISGINRPLEKIGGGTLILTGANTYTWRTFVEAGTLQVNGSIASSFLTTVGSGATLSVIGEAGQTTVANGGTLMGVGTVGTTAVAQGGTLLPGAVGVPGTLVVNGNLTLSAAANYVVYGGAPTTFARTDVTGSAVLGGTVFVNGQVGQRYTFGRSVILNATAGLSGTTFGTLQTLGFGNLVRNPHLEYDANNVYLVLDPNLLTIISGGAGGANVQAVAAGIDRFVLNGGVQPPALLAIYNLTGAALTNALAQLSNQQAASVPQAGFQAMGSFLSLILNPFSDNRNGGFGPALPYAPQQQASLPREVADAYAAAMPVKAAPAGALGQGLSIWASAYGGSGTVDGDALAGTNKTTNRIYGFATGLDHRVSPNGTIGFALAGGATNWNVANGLGGGNSEFFQAGLYGSHRFGGAAYVSAALAFAWHQISTSRTVFAVPETLAADFNANSFGGRVETGYRFAMRSFGVTPYAALQAQSFLTPAYAERATAGPGAFALNEGGKTTNNLRTELGVWGDHAIVVKDAALLTLRARAAWVRDSNTDRSASAVFQTLPGSNFSVNGARPAKDGALVSGVAEYRANQHWAVLAKFDGEFSGTTTIYAGTGTARYAW